MTEVITNLPSQLPDKLFEQGTDSVRERLSQEALFESFDLYIKRKYKQPVYGESATFEDEFKVISEAETNRALIEPLDESEPGMGTERPAMTVCIPIAIKNEDPSRIAHTIDIISKAQSKLDKPVEVVLWANARYDDSDEASVAESAQVRYQLLKDALKEEDHPGLKLKTALQIMPEKEATMSRIRSNYMEAVALEALEGGYGFDHPVMWLDADIASLSPSAFRDVEKSVRGFEAAVVHTNAHYSVDWLKDKSFKGMDDPAKAIVIGELLRRQIIRENPRAEYLEESGISFALGTYLNAGGVNTSDPINEAGRLRGRIRDFGPEIVPGFLRPSANAFTDIVVLPKTHMGLSARRHYELVKKHGPKVISNYNVVENGKDYTLYNDMHKDEGDEAYPIAENLGELYTALDGLQVRLTRSTESRREYSPGMKKRGDLIDDLLDKHFPASTEDTLDAPSD